MSLICSQLDSNQFRWQLQQFLFMCRTSPHATTKKSFLSKEINNLLRPISISQNKSKMFRKEEEQYFKHKTYTHSKKRATPNNSQNPKSKCFSTGMQSKIIYSRSSHHNRVIPNSKPSTHINPPLQAPSSMNLEIPDSQSSHLTSKNK